MRSGIEKALPLASITLVTIHGTSLMFMALTCSDEPVSASVSTTRSYHHRDLRSALLAAGLRKLEAGDVGDLSLRQIARDVGVSATAVYRHFPDKQALLRALADVGIARLGEAQQAAAIDARDDAEAFAATGRAYVRFALANPALFRLVFSHCEPLGDTVCGKSLPARVLQDQAGAATGHDPAAMHRLMIQAWALVHGLAMLMLDGQLPAEDALIDQVVDRATLFPHAV